MDLIWRDAFDTGPQISQFRLKSKSSLDQPGAFQDLASFLTESHNFRCYKMGFTMLQAIGRLLTKVLVGVFVKRDERIAPNESTTRYPKLVMRLSCTSRYVHCWECSSSLVLRIPIPIKSVAWKLHEKTIEWSKVNTGTLKTLSIFLHVSQIL